MTTWQVFLGGKLIDGHGREPVSDSAVVIEGERIRYAGPRAGATWPAEATVRNVTGHTIMPGLIDCHDHLAHMGVDLTRRAGLPPSLTVYETANTMRRTLEAGITAVRDAGGLDLGAKLAVERGVVPGPRLVISLAIITPTAGLGDSFWPSGLAFPEMPGLPSGLRNGPDACREGVREMVKFGADQIKIATTGGISSIKHGPLDHQYSEAEVEALIDEARAWRKRSFTHAYGGVGAARAIKAGVDSVEHGSYLHRDEDLLREMADRGTYLVPTLFVTDCHRRLGNPTQKQRAHAMVDDYRRTLERAFALGVRVAMGTDGGPYEHGTNARELRLLVEAGLTPMQAIVASTKTAAACIELDHLVGVLEPEKVADLIVVAGDPLANIGVLEDQSAIKAVLKGGVAAVDRLG